MTAKEQANLDFQKTALEEMRKIEANTHKNVWTLLVAALPLLLGYFKNIENSISHSALLAIISMFAYWLLAMYILGQAYSYRTIQKGISSVQKKLSVDVPKKWLKAPEEVLLEFFKPAFYGAIVGFFLSSALGFYWTYCLNNNTLVCVDCHHFSKVCVVVLLVIAGAISILCFFYKLRKKLTKKNCNCFCDPHDKQILTLCCDYRKSENCDYKLEQINEVLNKHETNQIKLFEEIVEQIKNIINENKK